MVSLFRWCAHMLLAGLFVAFTSNIASADPSYWHRVVVDSGEGCGEWCFLALDPNGIPGIAYADANDALAFTQPNPADANGIDGAWLKELVPVPTPYVHLGNLSLAFQSNGYPAVVFMMYDPNQSGLRDYYIRYAWKGSGGWDGKTFSISDELGDAALPHNRVWLSYGTDGCPWVGFNVFGVIGDMAAVARPEDPCSPGGTWEWGTIVQDCAWGVLNARVCLVVDPNGWPAVSYQNPSPGDDFDDEFLRYGVFDPADELVPFDGLWAYESVADPNDWVSQFSSLPSYLAFDANGSPGISFFPAHGNATAANCDIWYAERSSGCWDYSEAIHINGLGTFEEREAPLAYRFDNNPGICFRNLVSDGGTTYPLVYMWLDPNDANDTDPAHPNGVWQLRDVDARKVFGAADKGKYLSMVSDPNGLPAIAYADTTMGRLMYAVTADQPDAYTLTTWNEGAGHGGWGTIERDPNQQTYSEGSTVQLTAVPAEDKIFVKWAIYDPRHPGDVNYAQEDTNNPTTVLMEYDREVGAVFGCADQEESLLPVVLALSCAAMGFAKLRTRRCHA
ncbi:MAG: hypothetical protein JXQ73_28435 [Phycisphaerae bacterium]|nr:hypothetical protein [Phycisphaerae bacterium]